MISVLKLNGIPNPHATWFKSVVSSMNGEDRALLLYFASGQRRLPLKNPITVVMLANGRIMPTAATCFFQLRLPECASEAQLRDRLLYAIRNCSAIDGDANVTGNVVMAD